MNCPNCGGPSTANVCENCGTVLRETEPTSSINTEKDGKALTNEMKAIGKLSDDGKTTPTIKIIAIILAIIGFSGVSTILIGRVKLGIWQIVLTVIGLLLTVVFIGWILVLGVWIWTIVLAVTVEVHDSR